MMEKPDDPRDQKSRCKHKNCWEYRHYNGNGRCKKHSNEYQRRIKYKLSEEAFDVLMEVENCEICGKSFSEYPSCIDHSEPTGIVAGMLCNGCNSSIGKLKHDETIIQNALDYVKRRNDVDRKYREDLHKKLRNGEQ